jgi:uncharacterized repeat protein (TIGR03806 family)
VVGGEIMALRNLSMLAGAIVLAVGFAFSINLHADPGSGFGIENRVPWNSSRVIGSPDPPPPFLVERAFPKLKFEQPLYLVLEPGSDRFFLVERYGKIRVFRDDSCADKSDVLLALQNREVYSLAFHPDYTHNGFFYLFSNYSKLKPQKNVISRFHVTHAPGPVCRVDSEQEIISWCSDGHDGGCLAFGPDRFLYISTGDGTSGSDPHETGQDLRDLLAAVLRIDVDHPSFGRPYGIPADNPFIQEPGARPEIWAYGLRNPWRFSFDFQTGNLWLGDVGQDLWEMIYLIRRGGNYGWSVMEGSHPFQPRRKRGPTPILPPIAEHHHSESRSIIGGIVYRGTRLVELRGAYIYGDHETGKVWALRYDGAKVTWRQGLADTPFKIVAFAEDRKKEQYIIALSGEIYQLARSPETRANARFPCRLSETGLFSSVPRHEPAPGLISYSVNSPLWSDGASKERYLALPGKTQIGLPEKIEDPWDLPEGTVLVKTFSLPLCEGKSTFLRRIETRLLTRQREQWRGYTYLWNTEQTDADLVAASGTDRPYQVADAKAPRKSRTQMWHYPSRAECMVCHTRAAGFVLGINSLQLNKENRYGKKNDNQLRVFEHLGIFHGKFALPPDNLPHLPDPDDASMDIGARARSYLHANCSHCHVTDGGGNARMELGFLTPIDRMGILGAAPQHETFGIANARLIAAGSPERSLIYDRMARQGHGRMPPLASTVVDEAHLKLLRAWILNLEH